MILTLPATRKEFETAKDCLERIEHGTADPHIHAEASGALIFVRNGLERVADREDDELRASRLPPRHD